MLIPSRSAMLPRVEIGKHVTNIAGLHVEPGRDAIQ
jgi:hypothetical protein